MLNSFFYKYSLFNISCLWLYSSTNIGNLQLLEATPNEEKNNKDFVDWLNETFTDLEQLKAYKEKHFIPDVNLKFDNFEEFFEAREELIVKALKKALM